MVMVFKYPSHEKDNDKYNQVSKLLLNMLFKFVICFLAMGRGELQVVRGA